MLKATGVAFDKKNVFTQNPVILALFNSTVRDINQVIANNFDWCAFPEQMIRNCELVRALIEHAWPTCTQ